MSNTEIVELVGGLVAIVLAGVEALRTNAVSLTQVAVIVLGAVFVILAFI